LAILGAVGPLFFARMVRFGRFPASGRFPAAVEEIEEIERAAVEETEEIERAAQAVEEIEGRRREAGRQRERIMPVNHGLGRPWAVARGPWCAAPGARRHRARRAAHGPRFRVPDRSHIRG